MKRNMGWLATIAGLLFVMVGMVSAQQTTTTAVKKFEVISVDGNKVVLRSQDGSKEYTVPEDFRFDVSGQKISVHDLKPGMMGTATITTTTTVTPVTVTEIRNGEVMQAGGGSVIIRGPNGIKMFNQGDVEKRNITIIKDGKPVDISELRAGDHLSAEIVTEKPPKVMTQQQVEATIHPTGSSSGAGAAAPAPSMAARPAGSSTSSASSAGTGAGAGSTTAKKKTLPKTASSLPLVGEIGVVSLAIAAALTLRRRPALG